MSDLIESKFPPARPFQEHAINALRAGAIAGLRRQVLMAPTGAGKTYLALWLCDSALRKQNRVLFICDRKTLINQTSMTADRYAMPPHGIIQAANLRFDLSKRFQIASAQTLAVRGFNDNYGPKDVVVVDEAHTLHKPVVEFIAKTQAVVIGLSATPFTQGLGKIYDGLVNAATMSELTKSGVLVPLRVMSCVRPDMKGAKTTGGEYTAKDAGQRGSAIIGDIVTEWTRHAQNRKTIIFGSDIAHCEAIVKQFTEAKVAAALFTSHTDDRERERILREYRRTDSALRILVSVEALAKGFDVPDVGCVCDARPLRKSLSTFVQMIGRGLRSSPETGKEECLLLDFSGNVVRFANELSDVFHYGLGALDAGEKLDKEVRPEPKEGDNGKACPQCGAKPMGKRCITCGFEPVRVSRAQHEAGEAIEFKLFGGESPMAKDRRHLWNQLSTYVRAMREQSPKASDPRREVVAKYKAITLEWPPREWSYDNAPDTRQTPATLSKLHSMRIAWARGGGKRR